MAGAKKASKKEVILSDLKIQYAKIFIEGDSDLIINQMSKHASRTLIHKQRGLGTLKETENYWENLITSIRWRDPLPLSEKEGYEQYDEEWFKKILETNCPCISNFGLKKSFGAAVVRNGVDQYATKFDATVSVLPPDGGTPIEYASHSILTSLLPPPANKGTRVLSDENVFHGWNANFDIQYTESVYTIDEIVSIINLAGFGIGIGSGRSTGYGRYHVTAIK